MAKIRSLAFCDRAKLKKMVSFLGANQRFYKNRVLLPFPLNFLHELLPVNLKFQPEAFVAIENNDLKGMIALKPNKGNYKKWKINKLILNENSFLEGRQLIDYVVSQYGASGVNTFIANIESSQQEVLDLFAKGCGFKFCSIEQLWKMEKLTLLKPELTGYNLRLFKLTDACAVCELYNDSIHSQFRNSLCKSKQEFYDSPFFGLSRHIIYKYVLENKATKDITGYVKIKTDDNFNYLVELTLSSIHDDDFGSLMNFVLAKIMQRTRMFNLFVINKKYKQNSMMFEKYLDENGFTLKNTQSVLVKDYFKRINQSEKSFNPAIIFTDVKGKPAYKVD